MFYSHAKSQRQLKSEIKSLLQTAPAAIFCWCLLFLWGCKDPVIENNSLLNGENVDLAKDTLDVKVFSEFVDPISSNGVSLGLAGNLYDQNFGKTIAGTYMQCLLSTSNVTFGSAPLLDSAIFTLAYNGQYGKFDVPVDIALFELSQNMSDSTTYKTNDAFSVNLPPLAQVNGFLPNLTDSIAEGGVTYPPHFRMRLDDNFGNKILLADTLNLVDNTAFKNLFKGFYITPLSNVNGNGLVYFNLKSIYSKITLYYHNDTVSHSFSIPVSGVTVNHIDNIYTGTAIYTSVNTPNVNGEEKMYLQAGAGSKGKILISNLDSLPKNIAVNKAELVFTQSAPDTQFAVPPLLDLFRIDDAGQPQRLEDDGAPYYDGTSIQETVDGTVVTRYKFNIKRYFQKLLQGIYPNKGFYLQTLSSNNNCERVVIANDAVDSKYKVTLVVTYTKL